MDKMGTRLGILITGVLGGVSFMLYGVVSTAMGFSWSPPWSTLWAWATLVPTLMASWFR